MAIVRKISEVFESPLLLKMKEADKKRAAKAISLFYEKQKNKNKKSLLKQAN